MRQARIRRALLVLALAALVASSAAACPELSFRHVTARGSLRLYTADPPPAHVQDTLASVQRRVERSPLHDAAATHRIFICRNDWRWSLYSGGNARAAAVARMPLVRDVIVRGVSADLRHYVQADGGLAPDDRPLEYLLSHEITHLLTVEAIGYLAYRRLPSWVSEGYADYVARGGEAFDYDEAARGARATGAYFHYSLRVAHLLEKKRWTVRQLLDRPPDAREVDRELWAALPK